MDQKKVGEVYCKPAEGDSVSIYKEGQGFFLPEEMHWASGRIQVQSKQVTESSLEAKEAF